MKQVEKVSFPFASNDRDDNRHELALERMASVIDLNRSGSMMLAEMQDTDTGAVEYVLLGSWTDKATKQTTVIPFGKLFVDPQDTPVYAFPDGEGSYLTAQEDDDGESEGQLR